MFRFLRILLPFTLILTVTACGSSSERENGGTDTLEPDASKPVEGQVLTLPAFTPPEKNAIVGRIVTRGGIGIEGAIASIDGNRSGVSNYDGFYFIADVPPTERIVVRFAKPGFVPTTRTSGLFQDGRVTVNAVLAQQGAGRPLTDSGDTPVVVDRGTVALKKDAVVDQNGNPVTGNVHLRVTPVDIHTRDVAAAPGDFSATNALGTTVQLETFAIADYQLTDDDGNVLQIQDGKKAKIEMLLPPDTTLQVGDEVPAWYFDATSGRWIEEGKGKVKEYSQDSSRLAFEADVGHFSTWNCDQEMETTCVQGQVRLCDGTPAAGADLMAQGVDYDGTSNTIGSGDGRFCINARKGSTITLAAAHGYGANRLVQLVSVTTPDTTASCPAGPCATQDIVLPCTPAESNVDCDDTYFAGCKSCISGRVVDEDGAPSSAIIKVTTGTTTYTVVTDSNGRYCAPAAKDSMATLAASGAQGQTGTGTFTPTQDGACPSCESAPDIVLGAASATSESDVDFTECLSKVDGLTIENIVLNGANGALSDLDGGWILVNDVRSEDNPDAEYPWLLSAEMVVSDGIGLNGRPIANFSLSLAAAPTAKTTYVVGPDATDGYEFRAQAISSMGTIVGLGNEIYEITDQVGSGTITLDAFNKIGDRITGTFDLTLAPTCAPNGASLRIKGRIDSTARAVASLWPSSMDIESVDFTAWKCWIFEFYLWGALVESWRHGAIQASLDGTMIAGEDNFLNGAEVLWEPDTLNVRQYADQVTFSLTVDHPVPGANLATSGMLLVEGADDCYYEVAGGAVTLEDFAAGSTWVPGTFDVDFKASTWSTGTCPEHTVTGQFGAAVCRQ